MPDRASRPRIAVTMGDPAGVGPELCGRLLGSVEVQQHCAPIVFGDAEVLRRASEQAGVEVDWQVVEGDARQLLEVTEPVVFQVGELEQSGVVPGQVTAATGQASFDFIQSAIGAALAGQVAGVATGPIHKQAWKSAGIDFPGHTELFAKRFGTDRFCMMMTSPHFSCSLVTTHVGICDVPELLDASRIVEVIELTTAALERILDRPPVVVVLGLNPHAGEGGLFGNREEERIIAPAIQAAAGRGYPVLGPLPPDTAFLPHLRDSTDGYVCMYHDQGLIPFKAFNFETGVNITLGLPIVRTSVDHGTALDIAWQGKADVSSFIAATTLAARMAR